MQVTVKGVEYWVTSFKEPTEPDGGKVILMHSWGKLVVESHI